MANGRAEPASRSLECSKVPEIRFGKRHLHPPRWPARWGAEVSGVAWHPKTAAERDFGVRLIDEYVRQDGGGRLDSYPCLKRIRSDLAALTFDAPPATVRRTVPLPSGGYVEWDDGGWLVSNSMGVLSGCYSYATDVTVAHWQRDRRDAMHAALMELKANPTQPAPYVLHVDCVAVAALKPNGHIDDCTIGAMPDIERVRRFQIEHRNAPVMQLLRGPQVPQ